MKKWIVLLTLILAGCVATRPLSVERPTPAHIDNGSRDIVLLRGSSYELDISRALRKAGFNVRKFASVFETDVAAGAVSYRFKQAAAQYGLTIYPGHVVDTCIGGPGVDYDAFAFEITDLHTNEVVLIVEKGGWTASCGLSGDGHLFDDLANALRANWH